MGEKYGEKTLQWLYGPIEGGGNGVRLPDAGAAADKWRLVEDFTARY